jgi:4-amino-4-deoxy-L-arabinose transferase-like glycosyltransferase
MRGPLRRWEWVALAAITALAAALRLVALSKVSPDPFYDAAVRSMGSSLHNFFFGAFEPGGSVSIDKPPVDLWLQVASVNLFGFSSTTLKLPEALAGTAAAPLLYVAVRRMFNPAAGIAAAVCMAVLPVEVITARSDTMDAVMMALLVLALLLLVFAVESNRNLWLLAAAAALGVAFNVKLLESLVALPGLALFAYLGLRGSRLRRVGRLALAGVVYVAVALSWLTATLLVPAHERPWAIGSTNGSAWNAAFVFNGTDRLGGKSPEPGGSVYQKGHVYPVATQSQRDRIPIVPASPTRLLSRIGPLSGERLGLELLIALLLGIPALLWGLRRTAPAAAAAGEIALGGPGPPAAPPRRSRGRPRRPDAVPRPDPSPEPGPAREPDAASEPDAEPVRNGASVADGAQDPAPAAAYHRAGATATLATPAAPAAAARVGAQARDEGDDPGRRMRVAAAAGLGVWVLCGIVLFSHMARLHPRYVEGFTPAVAALLGIGMAWASEARGRVRLAALAVALVATVYYAERLMYGHTPTWWITLLAALACFALALLARAVRSPSLSRALAPWGVLSLLLVAVLAVPLGEDIHAIHDHVTDAGYVGALPGEEQSLVSSYLRAHQHGARYEVAAESATQIGSLVVQDARPLVVLTTYNGRVFTSVAKLKELIRKGQVRYAFLNTYCGRGGTALNPACSAPARWVRAHGTDVSREAGLSQGKVLYRLPGAGA